MPDQTPQTPITELEGVTVLGPREISSLKAGTMYPIIHDAVLRKIETPTGAINFVVLIAGAYGQEGAWVAPEQNGVAVLDYDQALVVADKLEPQAHGLHSSSQAQRDLFQRLVRASWEEFRAIINTSGRNRHTL